VPIAITDNDMARIPAAGFAVQTNELEATFTN
jgi:hypothetical protein